VEDGPHTEGVSETAESTSKVVRLPRDWLGPHEELVPFGRRAAPPSVEHGQPAPAGPPSADDFWGERAAAIHDAVQAPAEGGVPEPLSGGKSIPAAHRFGLGRRSLAVASIVAVAAVSAIVIVSAGSGHRVPAGPRLNMAAILSSGVSRILIGPPRIISANRASRPHVRQVRRASHRLPLTKPAPRVTQQQSSAPPPAPTYAARATPVSAPPPYHSSLGVSTSHADTSPPHASASASSGATVSPTGESGALGPVQSPNG
jgi:hypothetical protein